MSENREWNRYANGPSSRRRDSAEIAEQAEGAVAGGRLNRRRVVISGVATGLVTGVLGYRSGRARRPLAATITSEATMTSNATQDTAPSAATTGLIEANGARLYHEVRGDGPPVLFISGATGDAGHYERVAAALADEFTVVTYDRRGNSRSPRPAGWTTTSTDEQADDAAGLLDELGLAPATVFGGSGGAIIGLNLLLRHPEAVRGAVLHEPPLLSVLADPEAVMATLQPVIENAMATGGPPAAAEAFVRTVAGDAAFEQLDPTLRARMLSNGETLFAIEFGRFEDYRPDDTTLAGVAHPVQVMAGTESAPFFAEAAGWLAARLGVELATLPGGHAPYIERPEAVAAAIRPVLRHLSSE